MAETGREKITYTFSQKWSALTRQLRPYRSVITLITVFEVLSAIASGVVPYITGKFFDTLIAPHTTAVPYVGAVPAWQVLIGAWIAIQLLANGVSWFIDRKSRQFTTNLEANFQVNAYSHLLTLPISFHKTHRTGEITDNISRASWMLSSLTNTVTSLAPQFLTIIVGVVISFLILPQLAWVLVAGVAVYCLVLVWVLPATAQYQAEGFEMWNRTAGDAQDAYANFQTVKQAGAETYETDRIRAGFTEKAIPIWYRMELAWSNMNAAQRFIVLATQTAIFLLSVYYITRGLITIGDLIAFNAYAGMIIGPFVSLGGQWQTLQNGLIAVAKSERVFGATPEPYEPAGSQTFGTVRGEVSFKDVHFAYGDDQQEVLKGISFTAKPGDVVALVGETGVGKSTTVELISGYYFAKSGDVSVDGVALKGANLRSLRSNIAVVPQEVVLFNASIKDNIRYGRPNATDEEVKAAATHAHADAFIEKFPQGYEQEVGERGIKLSVGQKQRVAIARAMLRDPRILILDEPTSALDAETESYITESLRELMRGRTTFIIAHRLSTVREATQILVLKEGWIVEHGTHEELVKIPDGVYRHLYELNIGLHE
ncbi:MAG TPA: ABC transporter ATP-binding protein [Candidatus Paceibacterota bacterium]|nr:ABC transporter ATP-binding protein [Candidatus Paceibacterota bacterium]